MSVAFTLGKGMPRISSKNQVTLPVAALSEAGLRAGDQVTIEADAGAIVIRRAPGDVDAAIGIFSGLYEPAYLDELRKDWDR
jgi:bifunctional DNA-binding transcriptional regulator/antitoxin component of YhaV-PrlF toxin-antitoxin module